MRYCQIHNIALHTCTYHMKESKGPESQLILVMDNFYCACYCWSSEPKGKEKNDFDNNYCNGVVVFSYE